MCILPKKDSQGDFLVVQVVKWPVLFRNTWFFIVLGYDLSLDALTCLAELRDPPRGLWWSTACGGDLVIYLLDAIEAWDAGGLLERLREDLGSPSTLAKAGRWWMGCWTMAMDALECLGVGCFLKSRCNKIPFLIWFCEKDLFIFVMSNMYFFGMIFFQNRAFPWC